MRTTLRGFRSAGRRPYRSVADQNRGMLVEVAPVGESMVEELLAERRREAKREDNE
jgi:hypothetical protein